MAEGGDHLGGLALLIVLAIGATFALTLGLGGWLGRRLTGSWIGAIAGIAIGGIVGGLWAVRTFREDLWSPPAILTVEVPRAFSGSSVYLVVDRNAASEIAWEGRSLPFSTRTGRIAVSSSGITRVRPSDTLDHIEVRSSDGRTANGYGSRPLRPIDGYMLVFELGDPSVSSDASDPMPMDDSEVMEFIERLEEAG